VVSSGASVVLFLASTLLARRVLIRAPKDFLWRRPSNKRRLLRTVVGSLTIGVGIALLFLPGPGMVFIVIGLASFESPLRARALKAVLTRPWILKEANALRARHGSPPLEASPPDEVRELERPREHRTG
jgi:hypothetical protein